MMQEHGDGIVARRIEQIWPTMEPIAAFMTDSRWAQRQREPGISDFMTGNPQELALPGFVQALQKWSEPQNKDWFGYKMSEPAAQETVATTLHVRRGVPFEADDILMTNGAFAGLSVCLKTVVDPGDEVIYVTPP